MTSDADVGEPIATLKFTGHDDHLMRGPVTIGRDPRADEGATIEVDGDPLVSKSHFGVDTDQGDLIITDLGSSNGTYLHHGAGETAVPSDRWIPIPDGAEIEFGDQRMTIELADPAPASVPPVDDAAPPDAGSTNTFTPGLAEPASGSTTAAPASDSCANCRRELAAGSKFCDGCGTPTSSSPPSSPPQTPSPPETDAVPVGGDPGHTVVLPPAGPVSAVRSIPPGAPPTPHPAAAPPPGPQAYAATPPGAAAPRYGGVPPVPAPRSQPAVHGAPPPADIAGGLQFVDPTAAKTGRGTGASVLVVIGALLLAGLLVVGALTVLRGDDSDERGRVIARTVPTELDELWSTDVDGVSGFPGVGETAVYVASETDQDVLITSLRRDDGDENWESTIDDADFGVIAGEFDEAVVVEACAFDVETVCSAIGLDIDDGDEIWREPLGDGFAFSSSDAVLADDGDGLMLLDPTTGDRLERVRGEPRYDDLNAILVDDEGEVAAYDGQLQPLTDPVRVDDDAEVIAFDGQRLVVAIGDEIEYIDADGDVASGPFLDGEVTRLIAVDGSTLVAELGDEVVVYDVDGDDAVERWSERGTLDLVGRPDGGEVVIIDTGSERVVVDLESGEERFDVDGDLASLSTLVAQNAYVVTDRGDTEDFEGEATITAFDWETGDEIWSEDLDGAVRADEIVVVVETDGDVIAFG